MNFGMCSILTAELGVLLMPLIREKAPASRRLKQINSLAQDLQHRRLLLAQ